MYVLHASSELQGFKMAFVQEELDYSCYLTMHYDNSLASSAPPDGLERYTMHVVRGWNRERSDKQSVASIGAWALVR